MQRNVIVIVACAAALTLAVPTHAGEHGEMQALVTQWMDAYNAGDAAGVAALYMPKGYRMPPNEETVRGRDAIAAYIAAQRETGVAEVKIGLADTCMGGDHASLSGTYAIFDADGNEIDHGKWLNALHKVDGEWLIECDIWNSDLPPPGAASGG